MFKRENVGIYLDNVTPCVGVDADGEKRGEVELTLRIHPITPDLAAELDPILRSTLWRQSTVEISEKVKSVGFDLPVRPQWIQFRMAPDASRIVIDLPYARLSHFAAKKHKGVAGWALTFKVQAPTPSEHELALLHHGYTRQHFLTFADTDPDLLDAMEPDRAPKAPPQARPRRSGRKPEQETPDVH